jgi:hypothetical protein
MSKRRKLAVRTLCVACFIPFGHQHFFVNQEIQSPIPQEKQPSVPIAETNIDSGFNRFENFLEQPLVACVINDLTQDFIGNHKPSEGWQCAMNALQNRSRSYQ